MTQTKTEREFDFRTNHAPPNFDARKNLPEGFYEFLESLHRAFTPRQQKLAQKRGEILTASRNGILPNYLPYSGAHGVMLDLEDSMANDWGNL